jgi:hypothetical protein
LDIFSRSRSVNILRRNFTPTDYSAPDASQVRQTPAALVVAHPGHELRVHGWLETACPFVCILTDGSGRTGRSRLESTTRIVEAAGARRGPVYGALSDAELYVAVIEHEHSAFINILEELASMLISERIELVAGDAEEGYNPAHDVCRLLVNAAVRLVNRASAARIANYDFTLVGPPGDCSEHPGAGSIRVTLDDAAYTRKLSAARNYPELRAEVEAALSGDRSVAFDNHADVARGDVPDFKAPQVEDFRVEWLRKVVEGSESSGRADGQPPFYEAYGERKVQAGHYQRVLRYREHVLPLAAALHAHVEKLS